MNIPDPREDAAVDALITASLHLADREVSEQEAQAFLKNPPELSPEQEARLEVWQPDLFSQEDTGSYNTASQGPHKISSELYAAMNRKNAEDKHSAETEAELKRRRQEALERLKKKKEPPQGE